MGNDNQSNYGQNEISIHICNVMASHLPIVIAREKEIETGVLFSNHAKLTLDPQMIFKMRNANWPTSCTWYISYADQPTQFTSTKFDSS